MNLLLATLLLFQGQVDVQVRAKTAFDQVKICSCEDCNCIDCKCTSEKCTCPDCNSKAKSAFSAVKIDCVCQNCDCVDCKCTKDSCNCKECNDYQAVYARAVKQNQIVMLEVGNVPHITAYPWKVIQVPKLQGEKSGYIVGVPKNGQLVRLDFPPTVTQQRIRLDALHVIYPITEGYQECPTCPQGRMFVGSSR